MQFMVTYSIDIPQRAQAEARFLETGAVPPEDVQMLGRWHCTGERRGFMLIESNELSGITKFMRDWSDLLSFQITPVISDEQMAQIMQD